MNMWRTTIDKWVLVMGYEIRVSEEALSEDMLYINHIYVSPNISDALRKLAEERCFLIVILMHNFCDVGVVEKIRSLTDIPILVLAEKYQREEKIAILESGADEYMQYPKTVWEVVASCRALIRRYTVFNMRTEKKMSLIYHGNIFVDVDSRKVCIKKYELIFPRLEYDLFCLLASRPGTVFTYEQLFHRLWENSDIPTENSVHSCIRRIRRKLESIPDCPCRIENMRGVGYFFRQIEP